jgi:serine phosphatase RsbU (regulator of sigma subunit)
METLSIEDVAATPHETAVKRRFATRDLSWLMILLFFAGFVTVVELFDDIEKHSTFDVFIAGPNLCLVVLLIFVVRDVIRVERHRHKPGRWSMANYLRRHVGPLTISYLLVQYTLFVAFARHGQNYIGWGIAFPFFILAFRLLTSEIVLIHVYLVAAPIVMALSTKGTKSFTAVAVTIGSVNAFCAAIEIFASSRMRREVSNNWRERQVQAREQLRMRDELQYARQLQISMLPECAPKLDWVDVAGASVPATEVGGDYFDYFLVGESLAIVEGDVAGHGLASGIVLASLRSGFTLLRDALTDPAAVLRRLHDLVAETSRQRTLVTCAVLRLDPLTRRARIASAGHPPLIVRNDHDTTALELFAPPLGVRLPMSIAEHDVAFAPGDVFVLHTDGVYESASPTGESYGIERIVEVVRTRAGDDASTIRDAILRDVEQFRGGEPAGDDVTVVVARITGEVVT